MWTTFTYKNRISLYSIPKAAQTVYKMAQRKKNVCSDARLEGVNVDTIANYCRLLSHKYRLLIVCELLNGEKSVGEISTSTKIPLPALSRDLARLKKAGVVEAERSSRNVFYRLSDPEIVKFIEALDCVVAGKT